MSVVSAGRQVGRDIDLDFDPTSVTYWATGDFLILTGSNRKASLYTRYVLQTKRVHDASSLSPGREYISVSLQSVTIGFGVQQIVPPLTTSLWAAITEPSRYKILPSTQYMASSRNGTCHVIDGSLVASHR